MVVRQKNITYAKYQAFIARPENADRIFELIDGELVEKMPSFEPSEIALQIAYFLKRYLEENPIGRVSGADGGYRMTTDDDPPIFVPDVGYISRGRMLEKPPREVPAPPDFAVEVKSPTDRTRQLRRKAERYLDYGTRLVWLVFPATQTIEVYDMQSEDVYTLGIGDTLTGSDVLPGFTLPVAKIFQTE